MTAKKINAIVRRNSTIFADPAFASGPLVESLASRLECKSVAKWVEGTQLDVWRLFDYNPSRGGRNPAHDLVDRFLLRLKSDDERAVVAALLLSRLTALPAPYGEQVAHFVVMPSHKVGPAPDGGLLSYAKELARLTAGVDSTSSLVRTEEVTPRTRGGIRSVAEARRTMVLDRETQFRGKSVVVVDDIVTSGSSLLAARDLLKDARASKVLCLAVGATVNSGQRHLGTL